MDNLIFSLNATMPVFLTMVVGYVLGRIGMLKKNFCSAADTLVFRVALPCKLFLDMYDIDIKHDFDMHYVGFCAFATTISFFSIWGISKFFLKKTKITGEFVQACYRSSAAILGMAFIQNIYGESSMTALMILGSVPLFNVYAVLVLTAENTTEIKADETNLFIKTIKNIITNPIIGGILVGTVFAFFQIRLPEMGVRVISNLGSLTTPLALLSIGASFEGRKALTMIKPTICAAFVKLIVLVSIFGALAVHLGFYEEKLVSVMIMLGAPATPTCYIMAKNMGHDGVLSSSCIVLTTILSAVSITFWLWLFKSMGYI